MGGWPSWILAFIPGNLGFYPGKLALSGNIGYFSPGVVCPSQNTGIRGFTSLVSLPGLLGERIARGEIWFGEGGVICARDQAGRGGPTAGVSRGSFSFF